MELSSYLPTGDFKEYYTELNPLPVCPPSSAFDLVDNYYICKQMSLSYAHAFDIYAFTFDMVGDSTRYYLFFGIFFFVFFTAMVGIIKNIYHKL